MVRRLSVAVAVIISFVLTILVGSLVVVLAQTGPATVVSLLPGTTYRITCPTRFDEAFYQVAPGIWDVTCRALAATATPVVVPPTATPGSGSGASGFHTPGSHDGLNAHEHGTAPPAWVLASANQPFTQTREGHTGYKGVLDVSTGGVNSYFIGHIFSTEFARSHGDHDYQLWLQDPETGQVFYSTGILHFGQNANVHTSPIPERTNDTGERPIALSVGDGGCETWYVRPGSTVMDVGWTICGRYEKFSGQVTGGTGTFRTIDWVIPCTRLPASSPLQNNCRVEFGVNRLTFLANNVEHDPQHITRPIN